MNALELNFDFCEMMSEELLDRYVLIGRREIGIPRAASHLSCQP